MEALVLGQPIGENLIDEFYPLKDEQYYVLSSHDKKAIDRLENLNLNDDEMEMLFIRYKLNCTDLTLAQILIDSPKDAVRIKIDFTSRQTVENIDFPEKTNIRIDTPLDSIFINLDYGDPSFNDPKKVQLNIPDSYSACE